MVEPEPRPDQDVIAERLDALRRVIERLEEKFSVIDNWRHLFERDFVTFEVRTEGRVKSLEDRLAKAEGVIWKIIAFVATTVGGWIILRLLGLL